MSACVVGMLDEVSPMTPSDSWGVQIGGIHAPVPFDDMATALSLDELSSDHALRVEDFLRRHGGPAVAAEQRGDTDAGHRGWIELYASDGSVLRIEWSRDELRRTLLVSEFPQR
jgi:hypothetical protein